MQTPNLKLPLATSMTTLSMLLIGLTRTIIWQWRESTEIEIANGKNVGASAYSKLVARRGGVGKSVITWQELKPAGEMWKITMRNIHGIPAGGGVQRRCNAESMLLVSWRHASDGRPRLFTYPSIFRNNICEMKFVVRSNNIW